MKWWHIALIVSTVWIALFAGSAYLFYPAQLSPAQNDKLSEVLGEVFGAVLVFIWVIVYARWKFKTND